MDIIKIYVGKDGCRCGCRGRYFDKADKGFAEALSTFNSDTFVMDDETEEYTGKVHKDDGSVEMTDARVVTAYYS